MCRASTAGDATHTHTYTRLTALFPGLPRWASTRKVKPIWIFYWSTLAPHHSVFVQARCPSCCPTNSVKALKARMPPNNTVFIQHLKVQHTGTCKHSDAYSASVIIITYRRSETAVVLCTFQAFLKHTVWTIDNYQTLPLHSFISTRQTLNAACSFVSSDILF